MQPTEVVIRGTIKPDGSLELDQIPDLPKGRVQVTLKSLEVSSPRTRGLPDVINEIRKGQIERNFQGRSAIEIESDLNEGEEEYENKMRSFLDQ